MKEDFLHYVWQYQTFEKRNLRTEDGQAVTIYHPGYEHSHDGPDFLQAKITIGDISWAGHVEIHTKASDWKKHGHHKDELYNNVVLHVVWEPDAIALREDGTQMPVLVLKGRVSVLLWERYMRTLGREHELPCHGLQVPMPIRDEALDMALANRVWKKNSQIADLWHSLGKNWDEVAYRLLFRAFGFQLNAEAFEQLCDAVPLDVWRKHTAHPDKQLALLLGQAGFLEEDFSDAYGQQLQAFYRQMKKPPKKANISFKRKGVRPANAPLRRLVELASWLRHHPLPLLPLEEASQKALVEEKGYLGLNAPLLPYWQAHSHFGEPLSKKRLSLGDDVAKHLFINVAQPISWSKMWLGGNSDVPLEGLLKLPPEDNQVTRLLIENGFALPSAAQCQAAIGLYQDYCTARRCSQCPVGKSLMRDQSLCLPSK